MSKHWRFHPGVRSGDQLTLGERAADFMRNHMGSWPFLWSFLGAMGLWAITNTILLARVLHHKPFDPFPYILLNLMLSTVAGLQGVVLLIASKRQDQISSELARHDYETNERTYELVQEVKRLTEEVKNKLDTT